MSFTFVDVFAGCGGLSLGLMQSGAQGLLAIEKMDDAFLTLDSNLASPAGLDGFAWPSSVPRMAHDIKSMLSTYAPALRRLARKVEVIVGGPPCQGFSVYGKRRPLDGRNRMSHHYLDLVELLQPEAIVLENVAGIDMPFVNGWAATGMQSRGTAAWRIQQRLSKMGYATMPLQLCASDYGVPQYRKRFFMVGLRSASQRVADAAFAEGLREEIRADHLSALGLSNGSKVTCRQAIGDLETSRRRLVPCDDTPRFEQANYWGPRTQYQAQMHAGFMPRESPNSIRLAQHRPGTIAKFKAIQALGTRGFRAGLEAQRMLNSAKHRVHWLDPSLPAPTITTLPDDFIHYSEPRILTVRECARLQSFPDWFRFLGKYTSGGDRRAKECPRFTQVGNAVPPRLAQFLGSYLQEVLRLSRQAPQHRRAA